MNSAFHKDGLDMALADIGVSFGNVTEPAIEMLDEGFLAPAEVGEGGLPPFHSRIGEHDGEGDLGGDAEVACFEK